MVSVTHQKLFNNAIVAAKRLIASPHDRCATPTYGGRGQCYYTLSLRDGERVYTEYHCFIGETIPDVKGIVAVENLIESGYLQVEDLEGANAVRACVKLQDIHDYIPKESWKQELRDYARLWNLDFVWGSDETMVVATDEQG
jgi:hypothetical protein